MPSWLMLKPNSWRQERTEIRVTFSVKKKKKEVCIKRKFYLLNMIWDSYLTWFFSAMLFSTLQHMIYQFYFPF